jgi:peptide/nickel transport system ATP-binding protein
VDEKMHSPLIEVDALSKQFGRLQVLDGASFSIDRGETLGMFGTSGSGKTTVGKCLVLLERPDSGRIVFEGRDLLKLKKKELSRTRPRLQMIFQNPVTSLNPKMRAIDSISEPMVIHRKISREQILQEVDSLIARVGLRPEHLARYPQQLSGGEIQRAVLARIISLQPSFVVADEPTSMLDASVQAQILRLMMKIQEDTGLAYLFISHDIDVLRAVSDRIAYIENGSIKKIETNREKRSWARS